MKTTVTDICLAMNDIAPVTGAVDWDNSGLLLGDLEAEVKKIMLALDLTPDVAQQAIEQKVNMIITHHPFYFSLPKTLAVTDTKMEFVYALIKHNIAVYAAHTTLDVAKGGVNDVLAELLGLTSVEVLPIEGKEQGLVRVGILTAPATLESFVKDVKAALGADGITYVDSGKPVYKVAVVGGSGSDFMEQACAAGADTLVTGDVKFHAGQKAQLLGLNLIDGGHQCTEWPVLTKLEQVLTAWAEDSKRKLTLVKAEEQQVLEHL